MKLTNPGVKDVTFVPWSVLTKYTGPGIVQTVGGYMFQIWTGRRGARIAGYRHYMEEDYAVCVH